LFYDKEYQFVWEIKRKWLIFVLQHSFSFLAGAFILAPVIFAVEKTCRSKSNALPAEPVIG